MAKLTQSKIKSASGVTLIEVLTALALIAVVAIALAQVFITNILLLERANRNFLAASSASRIAERLISGGSAANQGGGVAVKDRGGSVLFTVDNASVTKSEEPIIIQYKSAAEGPSASVSVDKYVIDTKDKDIETRLEVYIPK